MSTIATQRTQVDTFIRELNAHNWDAAVGAFEGESPTFEDMAANIRLTGLSGITSGLEAFSSALPDIQMRVMHAVDVPGTSTREVVITGTHEGTYQGLDATSQRVRFACACIFEFDTSGRLKTERLYFDNETLLLQMHGRVLPYLPSTLRIAA